MTDLDEYTFVVNGVEHTARFDERDARRFAATPVGAKAAPKASNKARTPKNKATGDEPDA